MFETEKKDDKQPENNPAAGPDIAGPNPGAPGPDIAGLEADLKSMPSEGGPNPVDPGPSTADILEQLLGPTFEIVCPNWQISSLETKQLAGAYGQVIDKYFPDVNLGCEMAAILLTVGILGTRIGTPRHKEPKKPEKSETPPTEKKAGESQETTGGQNNWPPEGVIHG